MDKTWTPCVTVAAVIQRDDRFLLVEEYTDEGIVYNQPAGHLEDDESLLHAVVREVREETAWGFDPKGLVGVYRWRMPDAGRTYLRFCFHGRCSDFRPKQPLDTGILGIRWLNREELKREGRLRSPMVLTCIDDYLTGKSCPLTLIQDIQ
jgi:8-oxo-dGTP pyrophosphatase MutT (NUDIX family)